MLLSRRGTSLVTTLSIVAVISTLGFVLSAVCVQHLTTTSVTSSRQVSLDLARSAVSLAIAKMSEDPTYGTAPGVAVLNVPGQQAPDHGLLVFDKTQAAQLGEPFSLNNINGTAPATGSLGQPVAKATAQLVGIGYAGGQKHRIDVTLALPPFPYAVATSGALSATNGVEIAGIRALPSNGDFTGIPRLEADLVSNDGASNAVFLGANTNIKGNVQAVGTVRIDPSAPAGSVQISGAVKSNANREVLPNQQLNRYDPIVTGDPYTPIGTAALSNGTNRLTGRVRRTGNLDVNGGLVLDGSLLYVDGDLNISGGLKGKGVLVASGKVTIDGQSQFESGNGVAILSGRDTSITGSGSQGSFFQGLVYTQGKFSADRVTVVGNLISDDEANRPPVSLTDARVFTSGNPSITVSLAGTTTTTTGSTSGSTAPLPISALVTQMYNPSGVGSTTSILVSLAGQDPSGNQLYTVMVGGSPAPAPYNAPVTASQVASTIDSILATQGLRLTGSGSLTVVQRFRDWVATSGTTTPPTSTTSSPSVITIDPSSFLRIQDRLRVVVWREDR